MVPAIFTTPLSWLFACVVLLALRKRALMIELIVEWGLLL